jgi:hypothetical protein
MLRLNVVLRVCALSGAGALVACSDQSPVSPDAVRAPSEALDLRSQSAPGTYDLDFYKLTQTGLEKVSSLPVLSDELVLGALIKDGAGSPAQGGSVTFQYCSLKGAPPNDINNVDEAPLQACANGTAQWAFLGTAPVDATGNAYLTFGIVQIPRVVGFRCRYAGKGTGIAGGNCPAEDFTWTP